MDLPFCLCVEVIEFSEFCLTDEQMEMCDPFMQELPLPGDPDFDQDETCEVLEICLMFAFCSGTEDVCFELIPGASFCVAPMPMPAPDPSPPPPPSPPPSPPPPAPSVIVPPPQECPTSPPVSTIMNYLKPAASQCTVIEQL
eukprot:scaffold2295_cov354-Prasinococcus_capsulatus_cf.AAC.25